MNKSWILDVHKDDETGEFYLEFNEEIMEASGFKPGDVIDWQANDDGSFTLTKKETKVKKEKKKEKKLEKTQYVLVETISQFRERYVVEVPTGKYMLGDEVRDKSEWALDTVTMEEAKEFTQKHLGETIFSHRVVSEDEVMDIFRADEPYFKDWDKEQVFRNHVTSWKEQKDDSVSE
jgi:hypothetical protein